MIDNVFGGGRYLIVTQNNGYTPYVNPNAPMSGMVRVNNSRMEVYDGSTWHQIESGSANVTLTNEANEVLDWARERMERERQAKQLAETNPTVADALEKLQHAEEQLRIVTTLVQE